MKLEEAEPSLTLAAQRSKWRGQASAVPDLQCAKGDILPLTGELLEGIKSGQALDLDKHPETKNGISRRTWREFVSPLKILGLIVNNRGLLSLTSEGELFLEQRDPLQLASLMADRVRLFAEILGLLTVEQLTVQEVNERVVSEYELPWKTEANTRVRMTWLEVLGLVEWRGERRQAATDAGRKAFRGWTTVSPAALKVGLQADDSDFPPAPVDIQGLLDDLRGSVSDHDARNTYNIWVPSPPSDPNKIENMKVVVSAALEPIEKNELLEFVADRFGLRRSSVNSMMPFMRAGGFIQEVQRGVFVATGPAKAWIVSGSELDFIRILHAHMRFVGELLDFARANTTRVDLYHESARYGLNKDKTRWIVSFLRDAGLLEETSFSAVRTTGRGLRMLKELPLAPRVPDDGVIGIHGTGGATVPPSNEVGPGPLSESVADSLRVTATDPGAFGKAPGAAFEEVIRDAFSQMGFSARRISGAGDTDVIVNWTGHDGELRTAIIDAKSTASGKVAHTNVSDVALDTHKEKNAADFIAIVGAAFSGDTIQGMAQKRGWVLITADELARVVGASANLGLTPADVGLIFDPADGKSELVNLIETRERELDVVSLVISRLKKESLEDEPLSARDISLIERDSGLNPSVVEIQSAFEIFDRLDLGIVRAVETAMDSRFVTYEIGDARPAAARLRSLADAIEDGLRDAEAGRSSGSSS